MFPKGDRWFGFVRSGTIVGLCLVAARFAVGEESQPKAPPRTIRVAGVVVKWIRTDKEANFRRVEPLIRRAAGVGAKVVCTTECFLDGYAIADKKIPLDEFRALGEEIPNGEYFKKLQQLSDELDIHLVAGILERDRDRLFNTAVVIAPDGQLLAKYHKQKLEHEAVRITAGEKSSAFETSLGRFGVMICADRRDKQLVRRFVDGGAELLICPSGGMFGPKRNDPILQARSRENSKYIVFVHPAEFLVTAPDGSIARRNLVGDKLVLDRAEVGTASDSSGVFLYDVPVGDAGGKPATTAEDAAQAVLEMIAHSLKRPLLAPDEPWNELRRYVEERIPAVVPPKSIDAWEVKAKQLRSDLLRKVVLRGEAIRWQAAPIRVDWLDSIDEGPEYVIKKFRYEVLPGFWAPALLYEPKGDSTDLPVVINVNGHHRGGKAMPYKQRRCINLVRRGVLAFNFEFIDMGQLHDKETNGNGHNRLPQIDLCGTSGLAPFYLVLTRGLSIALSHERADQSRVGVTGLSGGGWQSILLASLDERITLANPVAGYCSLFGRTGRRNNIGDAEQIPADLCSVADYTHLTALVAPRPLLLTYNAEDDCCFQPPDVLPLLEKAARPVYELYDQPSHFQIHINRDPGTHNFEQDNREALYRFLQPAFFGGVPDFDVTDLPVSEERLHTEEELAVPLPEQNATLHTLAKELSSSLPRAGVVPTEPEATLAWQAATRRQLSKIVRYQRHDITATKIEQRDAAPFTVTDWRFQMNATWSFPATEFTPDQPTSTIVLFGDAGRAELAPLVQQHLASARRVVVVDLLGFGEAKGDLRPIELMLVGTVGGRPLGIEAGQVAGVARWASQEYPGQSVTLSAVGPRNSVIALVAAAIDADLIAGLELRGAWSSLKRLIDDNMSLDDAPELFCFGLLEAFDIRQLRALVAPRPLTIHAAE